MAGEHRTQSHLRTEEQKGENMDFRQRQAIEETHDWGHAIMKSQLEENQSPA